MDRSWRQPPELKTSGGYEVFVDARSGNAVFALRPDPGRLWLLEVDDPAGDARILVLGWGSTYGPIAAVLSQMFKPQARYTSISLAYQGAGAIFGGLSPLVSTLMYKATGSIWPVIALLIGMCVLSIVCLLFAPQHVDEATDTDGAPQGLNKESASA